MGSKPDFAMIVKLFEALKFSLWMVRKNPIGMTRNDGRNVEEFVIPHGQRIRSVLLRSGWYIDALGFVTNVEMFFKVGGEGLSMILFL